MLHKYHNLKKKKNLLKKDNNCDSYGNASTEGLMAGIGMSRDLDNGAFARGELSYVDYDDISITSTGGSTVKASVDSVNLTFSIGKSF